MCPPRRPRPRPPAPPRPTPPPASPTQSPQPNARDSGNMMARVERTPAPTPPPQAVTPPAPQEPAPKMRTIGRTSAGTTVSGQQTTSTSAPSRRRRQSVRMGRRSGTRSLRISRNPNTGQGNLNY